MTFTDDLKDNILHNKTTFCNTDKRIVDSMDPKVCKEINIVIDLLEAMAKSYGFRITICKDGTEIEQYAEVFLMLGKKGICRGGILNGIVIKEKEGGYKYFKILNNQTSVKKN